MNNKYDEIFYPNDLVPADVYDLDNWKFKISIFHFSPKRKNCVDLNYGYALYKSSLNESPTIHLVADNVNGILENPNDLENEINWNDIEALLEEQDINWKDLLRENVKNRLIENFYKE